MSPPLRLGLRRLSVADLARFQAYRGDPELGRYQGWSPMTDAAAAAFLAEMAVAPCCAPGSWFQIGIVDAETGVLVGDIGLHLAADAQALEIGFTLTRHAQGRGLAHEAVALALAAVFMFTPAQRVVAVTDTRNTASVRLLQRLGFKPTATLAAVFRGAPCEEQHFVFHRPGRTEPTLRAAQPADAAAVAGVLIDTRRERMPYAPSAHDDDDVRGWVAGTLLPGGGVTVAEVGGVVVGVLALAQRDGAGWIDQLMVHPAHAGAGIGKALLDHALATMPRPLRLWTFQANLHARGFYERHGFRAVEFTDGQANEERVPDVRYERVLA